MMKRRQLTVAGALAAMLLAGLPSPGAAQTAATTDPVMGVWRNPAGTVDVRTEMCGSYLCGIIVRASPQAVSDAARAGVSTLLGVHLLVNYQRTDASTWVGTAYVPDLNTHVASHLRVVDADNLTISGCAIGGLICKSQDWTRIG